MQALPIAHAAAPPTTRQPAWPAILAHKRENARLETCGHVMGLLDGCFRKRRAQGFPRRALEQCEPPLEVLWLDRKPHVRRERETIIALRSEQGARPEIVNFADVVLPVRHAHLEYAGEHGIFLRPLVKPPDAQAYGLLVRACLRRLSLNFNRHAATRLTLICSHSYSTAPIPRQFAAPDADLLRLHGICR